MVLGCPRGDCSSHQLIKFSSNGARGKATRRAGEYTRKRAIDVECSVWSAGDGAGGVRCCWVRDGVPMTATSPRSVTESASSTNDPDAQTRRANEGGLTPGFQSDLTASEDAMDVLLAAEEFPTERLDESVDHVALYAKYRRLAAEQAALRRVAMLVARGVGPLEVFGAVAEEMRRCVPADTAGLWRFESDGGITLVAAAADPAALARWPGGSRTAEDGDTIATG